MVEKRVNSYTPKNTDEFLAINKDHIEKLRYWNLRRIYKTKRIKLSRSELGQLIYSTLLEHPEGLTRKQIVFFTGLPTSTVRSVLTNPLEYIKVSRDRFIYKRHLDREDYFLYYAGKHAKKLIRQMEKQRQMVEDLKVKLTRLYGT